MDKQKDLKVFQERNQIVVKSNELIQRTRYKLSLQEQKIILYIISKIKPDDDDLKIYSIDLKNLCAVCGIQDNNGKNYINFKKSIQNLRNKSFWIETPQKDYLISWLEHIEIDKYERTVLFRLDDRLKPYLIKLQSNFTQYELCNILAMNSKYSIRFYELLRSYLYKSTVILELEALRNMIDLGEKYKEYKNFRRYILDKAIQEINKYTEMQVDYRPLKQNKTVVAIEFKLEKKDLQGIFKSHKEKSILLGEKNNESI